MFGGGLASRIASTVCPESTICATHRCRRFLSVEPLLEDLGEINLEGIQWVIVGGESGPGARPMNPDWVNSLMEQCSRNIVPFFFKQWGGVRKKQTGRELNGRTFDEFPQLRRSEFPSKTKRMQILRSVESKIDKSAGSC